MYAYYRNPLLHNEDGNATVRRGASLSGLPRVPFRRHDLAAFVFNPVLGARRKLFEGPADRRGLFHGGVPNRATTSFTLVGHSADFTPSVPM